MTDVMTIATLLPLLGTLILAGAIIGVLAGLFGIGGGAISVPVFYEIFRILEIPYDVRMPLAVGTSLAVIIPTSIMSARGHYAKGTMNTDLIRIWAVPVVLGVLVGSVIARFADPFVFKVVFVAVAGVNAIKLLFGGDGWRIRDSLPGKGLLRVYGTIVGVLSALMGIGGGAITNLLLTLHGVPIHRAISTAAGVGVLIALPGTLGYVYAGWGREGLPPDATGFVSWLTFAATIPTSLLTTRFGVTLAHKLKRRTLETAFGIFLVLVSARFLFDLL
jgi:uncharacterized protein